MKKRIGTKLYDTDSSEQIYDNGVGLKVYRKRTREREFFYTAGEYITPLTENEALAMIGENTYIERAPESKRVMIGVDRVTHQKIASSAKKAGLSISEFIKKFAEEL